jgi:cytochrome c-type biogenesis protein
MYGISVASGIFLVLVGVMLYTNSLTILTSTLEQHGIGWYIGQ